MVPCPRLRLLGRAFLQFAIVFLLSQPSSTLSCARQQNEKPSVPPDEIGQPGSRLVASFRVQPKTIIPIVSPNVLVGARRDLGNFHPAILEPHTLWNCEVLFLAPGRKPPCP
jgi:hypothetical protein